jgi:hypothetical protein
MKMLSILLALCMVSNTAFADCNFSTDITKQADGTYSYTKECHIKVGQLVQDNKTKDQQISDLNQAITLKDLAITKSDQRAQMWMDTSFKLEDDVQKMNKFKSDNQWIYFGLGVLTVFAAGMATSSLTNRH